MEARDAEENAEDGSEGGTGCIKVADGLAELILFGGFDKDFD